MAKIKQTIISGIILFLPVFAIIAIAQKTYKSLSGFGKELSKFLGIESFGGIAVAPVLTTLILLFIFYFCGLLVRYTLVTRVKEWIENSFLVYLPNYNKYKANMMAKLQPAQDHRRPALVEVNDYLKPCLVVSESGSKMTVFLPSTPDTDIGEVIVVESGKVKYIDMELKAFKTSILMAGDGLKYD